MKLMALIAVAVLFCLVAPAGAAKKVVVTTLPEPVRAFAETERPSCFDPDWNLARVVSRGASAVRVTSKISPNALLLSIK